MISWLKRVKNRQHVIMIMDTLKLFCSGALILALDITIQVYVYFTILQMQGGGESLDQLHRRCTSSLQRIGSEHKGTVARGGISHLYLYCYGNFKIF